MKFPSRLAAASCFALGFATLCGSANAQGILTLISPTTLNGGFEAPDVTAAGSKGGFDAAGKDIVNWGNTNTTFAGALGTYNDNGVDQNAGGANSGNQFAFFHGGEGGAFNLTTYQLNVGDQISLSWFGRADTIAFRLFSSTNGTYATAATLAEFQQAQAAAYTLFTPATYTVTAADLAGGPKTLGVSIFNPTVGYANVDDVILTVTAAVPEPSTVMACAVGGIMLLGLGLRRRKVVA